MLGSIIISDMDTHHVVDVDFFDKSTRKSWNFQDNYKYDMAYLGEQQTVDSSKS